MQISLLGSDAGAVVPTTISSHCCAIPFTLNGNIHYSCTDNGAGVGCFYGDRQWKQCRQPAGRFSKEKTCSKFRIETVAETSSYTFYFYEKLQTLLTRATG